MLQNIINDAARALEVMMKEDGFEVSGADLGLDPRALYRGTVVDGALVVRASDNRSLRYYGGFEYVNEDAVAILGDYVIYYADEDERVAGALECAEECK